MAAEGLNQEALDSVEAILAHVPANKKALYLKAKMLVNLDRIDEAKAVLAGFSEGDDKYREAKALAELMAFQQECARTDLKTPLELAYRDACAEALQGNYQAALDGFAAIVMEQRNWRDEAAHKAMVTLFGVLGPKHPLTWEYRAKLNTLVFI